MRFWFTGQNIKEGKHYVILRQLEYFGQNNIEKGVVQRFTGSLKDVDKY
jgi:hypothetical protein